MPRKNNLDYNPDKICSVEGCDKNVARLEWCRRHYRFNRLYGDPNYEAQTRFREPENRTSKICITCKEDKPIGNFSTRGPKANNRTINECKTCFNFKSSLARYSLTIEQYQELVDKYDGACYICDRVPNKLFIDHDHSCCPGTKSCGRCVRGLLCPGCNMAIGNLREDPDIFARALSYLRPNGETAG